MSGRLTRVLTKVVGDFNRALDGGSTSARGLETGSIVTGQTFTAVIGWYACLGVGVHVFLVLALVDELVVGIVVGEDGVGLSRGISAKSNRMSCCEANIVFLASTHLVLK